MALGIDEELVWRHPFPGPGLAIRIIGDITRERVALLQVRKPLLIWDMAISLFLVISVSVEWWIKKSLSLLHYSNNSNIHSSTSLPPSLTAAGGRHHDPGNHRSRHLPGDRTGIRCAAAGEERRCDGRPTHVRAGLCHPLRDLSRLHDCGLVRRYGLVMFRGLFLFLSYPTTTKASLVIIILI